jgi:hypothetical protein
VAWSVGGAIIVMFVPVIAMSKGAATVAGRALMKTWGQASLPVLALAPLPQLL